MKVFVRTMLLLPLLAVVLLANANAGPDRETTWTFDKKELIKVETVSGDCIVKKGVTDKIEVEVISSYRPRDSFEPKYRERSHTLKLSERMYGSNSGYSTWTLTVPEGTEIEFSTASGDLMINGISGDFSGNTASGNIEIENCKGDFDFNTASGDIYIRDCTGEFELNTASGEIVASRVVIDGPSEFSTASGEVEVELAETSKYDLDLSTASGRVTLDYNGNPIEGYFEFVSKARRGRIICPFDFDDEETFRRWDEKYVRKSFTRGSNDPQVFIETASGKVTLRK